MYALVFIKNNTGIEKGKRDGISTSAQMLRPYRAPWAQTLGALSIIPIKNIAEKATVYSESLVFV